jgi:Chaperone of endosialidase
MKKICFIALAFTFQIAAAQNVGIGTSTPIARLHVADSNVLFTGAATLPAIPANPPVSGAGTRMMWYPDKAAFRVGNLEFIPDGWDKDNIGKYSLAAGVDTKASGVASVSLGNQTTASNTSSTSMGELTIASGLYSTSMGQSTTASGTSSTSMGDATIAGGNNSTSMGSGTNAIGTSSTSMGQSTTASGTSSTSMGLATISEGNYSTSMGSYTKAKSNSSLVIGKYNDITTANRLFEIGNGTADNARSNALTVLDNGKTGIGTTNPVARLHVADSSVVFTGSTTLPATSVDPPISGAGTRLMWYPDKAAFRAGNVGGNNWNKDSIGNYSFATGSNTKAKGIYSTSFGNSTFATGNFSTSMGSSTTAIGGVSTSMGSGTIAIGSASTSMGSSTIAKYNNSLVIGTNNDTISYGFNRLFEIGNGLPESLRKNAMTVLENGNVGIATANPVNKLSVFGNANFTGNVGIGISSPLAGLHVVDNNVVFTGPTTLPATPDDPPIIGAGTRLMWYPDKAAFRVGNVGGNNWNKDSIGNYSFATGSNTKAKGIYSTSFGNSTFATGNFSTSMGSSTTAIGGVSTSMGSGTIAIGSASTSMGSSTIAKYNNSLVIGTNNDTISYGFNRLFEIGNGLPESSRKNAMTVLENGNVGIATANPVNKLTVFGNADFAGNVGIGTTTPTTAKLVISGASGIEGIDLSSTDQYANMRVIRNNLFGLDKDMFIGYQSGLNSTLHLYSNNNETVTVKNGNLGIGTNAPATKLDLSGGDNWDLSNTEGDMRIGNANYRIKMGVALSGGGAGAGRIRAVGGINTLYLGSGTTDVLTLFSNGNATLVGTLTQSSDIRLKKNIVPLHLSLNKLTQLNGYTYNWISKDKDPNEQIGLIAQEVQKLYPQLVSEVKGENGETTLAVNYTGLIPVMIESIKEQQKQIDELKLLVQKILNK